MVSSPHRPTGFTHGGVVGLGGPASLPPPPQRRGDKRFRRGLSVAIVIAVCLAVVIVGGVGVYVGSRLTSSTSQRYEAQPVPVPSAPTEQVRAATVDLCTRFAAGYRAMPAPQNTGFDVIPSLDYIADALSDNPSADNAIRNAVAESLRLARDQVSHLSNEAARGAIQPSMTWTPEMANQADQRVWDLCRAYGG